MSELLDEPVETPRKKGRRFLVVLLLFLAITSVWWGRLVLSQLAYFRIREVEVTGTRFLDPLKIAARMRVDTLRSIWSETETYRRRVESHPQVTSASIERKLPSRLLVHVQENLPIALVPTATGFLTFDSTGHELPIDPRLAAPDLPIVSSADTAVLSLLGRIRTFNPFVFERISEISRPAPNEFLLLLVAGDRKTSSAPTDSSALDSTVTGSPVLRVRVPLGVTVTRLTDIFPVESDLKRRQVKVAELDLRYRDQVIARLQ
ncbi:MAG: FtsQ-type POTRA domain-containing protein [Gemmatimonadaceae bacterium]|nr:FtsQ-type POTRA domain-containing protein [Gemmatimonadaceae bacterium]